MKGFKDIRKVRLFEKVYGLAVVFLFLGIFVFSGQSFAGKKLSLSEAFVEAYKKSDYSELIRLQMPPKEIVSKLGNSESIARKIAVSVRNIEYCVKPYFEFEDYTLVECEEDSAYEILKKAGLFKEYVIIPTEKILDVAVCNKTCMAAGTKKDKPIRIELLICSSRKTGKSFINGYTFYRTDKISSSIVRDAICLLSKAKPYLSELYHSLENRLSSLINRF